MELVPGALARDVLAPRQVDEGRSDDDPAAAAAVASSSGGGSSACTGSDWAGRGETDRALVKVDRVLVILAVTTHTQC